MNLKPMTLPQLLDRLKERGIPVKAITHKLSTELEGCEYNHVLLEWGVEITLPLKEPGVPYITGKYTMAEIVGNLLKDWPEDEPIHLYHNTEDLGIWDEIKERIEDKKVIQVGNLAQDSYLYLAPAEDTGDNDSDSGEEEEPTQPDNGSSEETDDSSN